MTDKLTDKDVIKALPNMTYGGHYCAKCKYDNGKGNDRCGLKGCKIARYALDLINRLKAENEKNENIIRLADKTIETANAEIERLQNILICFMDALGKVRKVDDIDEISLIPLMSELNKQYRAELKDEAYKEFAERLKTEYAKGMSWFKKKESYYVDVSDIDNLLKELVGENNV